MELHFKNLPSCGLPYNTINAAMTTIIKLFENIPFLPDLQNADSNDSLLNITLSNVPGIVQKEDGLHLIEDRQYKNFMKLMDDAYVEMSMQNLEPFKIDAVFMDRYIKAIHRIKPHETIIRLYGPFSLMYNLRNVECMQTITDRTLRKFFVQLYVLKSLWFINKIQTISYDTKPIIILEEPFLNKFSNIKRQSENIESYLLVDLYAKIFEKIHKNGGFVGIQCFEKCDWKIPLDAGVDIISFDAYHNPHNLIIISAYIQKFLQDGGFINWGIVPMDSADILTKMNVEFAYDRFTKTVEELIGKGISRDLVYNNSLVSVVGDVYKLPLLFSEKALLLANKIAAKLATK